MAEENSRLEKWSTALKNMVSTFRDGVFLILLLLLLLSPSTVKDRLLAAGFTKGNIGGMEWEGQMKESAEQTKAVGEVVSKADDHYGELIDRLTELQKREKNQAIRKSLNSLSVDAKKSQVELMVADKAVKQSLSTQQSIVEAIRPTSVAERGWLYLGRVNERKDEWSPGSPVSVSIASPAIAIGAKLAIRDDTYWRTDNPNQHADSPILAVAKTGTVVNVESVDYSRAKEGGWLVWIKARRES